jgi:hypothetical protein
MGGRVILDTSAVCPSNVAAVFSRLLRASMAAISFVRHFSPFTFG